MLESEDAPLQTRLSQRPDIIRARVRDRSNPRSGRHVGPARGGADGRGAAPPRSGWRGAEAHRAARARPHPAGDHRRRGRRPAARLRGRPRRPPIVNGEIYNHRELRKGLEARGHRLATNSDSEVIVHAYEEHGLDCVRHLNGIFAFALWDDREKRLVAARDAFGVKPLYWWSDGRRVALASEIGALLAAGLVEPRVDRTALDHYLACRFVPAPRTLFEGIQKLPPAVTARRSGRGQPARDELARGARRPARLDRRRRARGPARRALHRRGRAPDDVRRSLRRLPLRRRRQRGRGGRHEAARRGRSRQRSRSASRATATWSTSASSPPRAARIIGTDHHDTAMRETDFLAELARCDAAPRGAVRHPDRARPARSSRGSPRST